MNNFMGNMFQYLMGKHRPQNIEIKLNVHLAYDGEAKMWYIAQSDIPGLNLEAERVDDLIRSVQDVGPELIDLNLNEILAAQNLSPLEPDNAFAMKHAMSIRPFFDSSIPAFA